MKIGIIEDDVLLNQSLKIRLQKEGYQVLCMHTQKEAEEQLAGTEDYVVKPAFQKHLHLDLRSVENGTGVLFLHEHCLIIQTSKN